MPRSHKRKNKHLCAMRYQKAFLQEEPSDQSDEIVDEIAPKEYNKEDNQQSLDQAVYQALLQAEKAKTTEEQIKIIYRAYNGVLLFGPSNYEHFTMIDDMNGTIVKAVQTAINEYTLGHINEALQVMKSISKQNDEHIPELLRKEIAKLETAIKFYSIIEMSMDLGNKTAAFDIEKAKQLINKCRDIINQIQTTYNVVIAHMPPQPRDESQNNSHAWPDTNQEQETYPPHSGWPGGNTNWSQTNNANLDNQNEHALISWPPNNTQSTTRDQENNNQMSKEEYIKLQLM